MLARWSSQYGAQSSTILPAFQMSKQTRGQVVTSSTSQHTTEAAVLPRTDRFTHTFKEKGREAFSEESEKEDGYSFYNRP